MPWLMLIALLLSFHAASAADFVPAPNSAPAGAFTVLCYHEARDDVRDYPDRFAVDSAGLVKQFAWLRGNGYTPVSLDDIVVARQGGKPLPAKALLLTFDDAYLSFYTRVYPLLRAFRFPAVLAVVGVWIDNPHAATGLYGEMSTVTDAIFPAWRQLREMADSGFVEIASHTYDLHRGVLANPQGNLQPAATARRYDADSGTYENDASWGARVSADLAYNAAVIERETGRRPRAIVWPYGSYNDELTRMAGEWGMTIGITLEDGINAPAVPLTAVRRTLIEHNPALAEFMLEVRGPLYPEPVRVVQVSLDEIYSADPLQQERNLSDLLTRIQILKPTHVYLQATADSDGDGYADAAYFPNRHLPLRGDLYNRTAWQLASRVDVKVFAVMPVAGFRLAAVNISEVYADLARHARLDGVVFADTISRTPAEDTAAVTYTLQLAALLRTFRAPLKTVRALTMAVSPGTAIDLTTAAQFAAYVAAYDYVALPITLGYAGAENVDGWPGILAAGFGRASGDTELRRKGVFMLRNSPHPVLRPAGDLFATHMRALQISGALNFGYVPDAFLKNDPPLTQIAPAMSLREYPLAKENPKQ